MNTFYVVLGYVTEKSIESSVSLKQIRSNAVFERAETGGSSV